MKTPHHLQLPGCLGLVLSALLLTAPTSHASSATWKLVPLSGDWNTAANWTPATVPNSPADTATFGASNATAISTSASTEVNGIVFNSGASAFTVTAGAGLTLTLSGAGIINNSGTTETFVPDNDPTLGSAMINFTNRATAGISTTFNTNTSVVIFSDSATAGFGTFMASVSGYTSFGDNSTADHGTFINSGGTPTSLFQPGKVYFFGTSTAADAMITNNGGVGDAAEGGYTSILESSNAGNATLIANGGSSGGDGGLVYFNGASSGGRARVELFGNASVDISPHMLPGVTIGSIEGKGSVFLGANNLAVGSNSLSTTFSGVIQDGGPIGGSGGSLTKIGVGTLTLSKANTYTGGTTVSAGTLVINNTGGSGTGTGLVQVTGGTLAGNGTIAGAVNIGGNVVAVLAPGNRQQATLTIQGSLTLGGSGTYTCTYRGNGRRVQFDQVVAHGVIINDGAGFDFPGTTSGNLQVGTVLTVISNTSSTPIAGIFSNLPDGAVVAANGGNFQVNYEGGDGNDLTLTVVP